MMMMRDWMPPAQRQVSDWLATPEGHAWQDADAACRLRRHDVLNGMTTRPWISLVPDGRKAYRARTQGWFPRRWTYRDLVAQAARESESC